MKSRCTSNKWEWTTSTKFVSEQKGYKTFGFHTRRWKFWSVEQPLPSPDGHRSLCYSLLKRLQTFLFPHSDVDLS